MGTIEIRFRGANKEEIRGLFVAAAPKHGARAPGVVLVQEALGLDRSMESLARRFAAEGFAVLAPDLWSREGEPGPTPSDRRALGNLEGALAWLEARADVDEGKLAVVGFGLGGNLAFQLACTSRRVKAVVDVRGELVYAELSAARPIQPLELALNLSAPLLAFFDASDPTIPPEHVERLRGVLEHGGKHFEIVASPSAGQGLFEDSTGTGAWHRTLAFLREAMDVAAG